MADLIGGMPELLKRLWEGIVGVGDAEAAPPTLKSSPYNASSGQRPPLAPDDFGLMQNLLRGTTYGRALPGSPSAASTAPVEFRPNTAPVQQIRGAPPLDRPPVEGVMGDPSRAPIPTPSNELMQAVAGAGTPANGPAEAPAIPAWALSAMATEEPPKEKGKAKKGGGRGVPAALPVALPAPPAAAEPAAAPEAAQAALPPEAAPAAMPVPAKSAPSLLETYRELMGKPTTPVKGDLTPDQKERAQLAFGLSILNSLRGGGQSFAGALGAGGSAALAYRDNAERANIENLMRAQQAQREDAYRTAGVANMDVDNQRQATMGAETMRHNAALERLKSKELEVLQRYREGQITEQRYKSEIQAIHNQAQSEIQMARAQAMLDRINAAKQFAPSELEKSWNFLERKGFNPEQITGIVRPKSGYGEDDAASMYRDYIKEYNKPNPLGELMGPKPPMLSFQQFSQQLKGGAAPGTPGAGPARPTSKAEFDALPMGAPYVNPKDGKVYTKTKQ